MSHVCWDILVEDLLDMCLPGIEAYTVHSHYHSAALEHPGVQGKGQRSQSAVGHGTICVLFCI